MEGLRLRKPGLAIKDQVLAETDTVKLIERVTHPTPYRFQTNYEVRILPVDLSHEQVGVSLHVTRDSAFNEFAIQAKDVHAVTFYHEGCRRWFSFCTEHRGIFGMGSLGHKETVLGQAEGVTMINRAIHMTGTYQSSWFHTYEVRERRDTTRQTVMAFQQYYTAWQAFQKLARGRQIDLIHTEATKYVPALNIS